MCSSATSRAVRASTGPPGRSASSTRSPARPTTPSSGWRRSSSPRRSLRARSAATGARTAPNVLRGACLYEYGGVWMDVGTVLFRKWDDVWARLEDPECPYQVAAPLVYQSIAANHFIASRRGDPCRWRR